VTSSPACSLPLNRERMGAREPSTRRRAPVCPRADLSRDDYRARTLATYARFEAPRALGFAASPMRTVLRPLSCWPSA
jgi:hypothetical protein